MVISCSSEKAIQNSNNHPQYLDLLKFEGRWYVLGQSNIAKQEWYSFGRFPVDDLNNSYELIELYQLFSLNQYKLTMKYKLGSFYDDFQKENLRIHIEDKSNNSIWNVSRLWPIGNQFIVHEVDKDYQYAIIGTPYRHYVKVLARQKKLPIKLWKSIKEKMKNWGYDTTKFRLIPHQIDPYFADKIEI